MVATLTVPVYHAREGAALPAEFREPHWYAVQTRANHEMRVREQLELRTVENYLPVYESVRRWKDRRVRLEVPLFSGYVFVRLALCDRLRVLQIPSVARLVGFGGWPYALADEEIQTLRQGLTPEMRAEPYPYLKTGQHMRVRTGPLQGLQGILVSKKNRTRFVISLDLIQRSVAAEIDVADLEPVRYRMQGNSSNFGVT